METAFVAVLVRNRVYKPTIVDTHRRDGNTPPAPIVVVLSHLVSLAESRKAETLQLIPVGSEMSAAIRSTGPPSVVFTITAHSVSMFMSPWRELCEKEREKEHS